jgi:hypothetical protein
METNVELVWEVLGTFKGRVWGEDAGGGEGLNGLSKIMSKKCLKNV